MKRIITVLSLFWLLNGCSSQVNQSSQQIGNVANCPQPSESLPEIKITTGENFYQVFNYQIRNIIADEDTLNFQSLNHDFVFCRGNNNWSIQPGTWENKSLEPQNYEDIIAQVQNPPYQTIELDGNSYQYRIILDPNPFPDFHSEAKQVVFELIRATDKEPLRQVLYTLEQMKKAQTGFQLGVPSITKALIYDQRLFWSISPEQGEGNGGIATIASYDPQTDEIAVIQPEEMKGQQIIDMTIAGEPSNPTFWLATQISGEGNPYLPGMGLVAYNPDSSELTSGSLNTYHVRNNFLVGAIPSKLYLEEEQLWVGTGNGICLVQWQTADEPQSWSCWRFALMAKLPEEGVPLYSSLLNDTSAIALEPNRANETLEVLWWSPQSYETAKGRYEVKYDEGFTVQLNDQGAMPWSNLDDSLSSPPSWESLLYWPGRDWHWSGNRFVRGFDEVPLNFFGGGPNGIGSWEVSQNNRQEINAVRGDLDLLELTEDLTKVKHYSGWIEDSLLTPYLTIIPQAQSSPEQPNPLEYIRSKF